ncbi:MAG: hypothetical protein WCF89_06840, partial [Candidatus Sulfotelmatobacter sp.]
MRTNRRSPRFYRFRASFLHDGRERIRIREIHQMNCFDNGVCVPGMQGEDRFPQGVGSIRHH